MTEQFANDPSTTLNGGINSSVTSLIVTSAIGFPNTGNFRILIDSEYLQVTNVSESTFTVVRGIEGSTAASHLTGAAVTQIVTAGAMQAFVQIGGTDIGGTPTEPEVIGILNHALPSLATGFLNYTGSAWELTPEGTEGFAPIIPGVVVTNGAEFPTPISTLTITPLITGRFAITAQAGPGAGSAPSSGTLILTCALHSVSPTTALNAANLFTSCEIDGTGLSALVTGLTVGLSYDITLSLLVIGDNYPTGSPAIPGGVWARETP